ncbi:hypothetical protein [Haloechinothrix halophila]|uniref:hypothetical protein n=1 Tax=Haloechinothrix halophila TaxID=1069073 RepID=UPI0003FF0985|nr:hypothetical protein [Haloechinothrix halophila]
MAQQVPQLTQEMLDAIIQRHIERERKRFGDLPEAEARAKLAEAELRRASVLIPAPPPRGCSG